MSFDPKAYIKSVMESLYDGARPLDEMYSVKGKVAVVTGGTSGLGFNVALRLLQGGAKVVVASFSEAEAELALPLFAKGGFADNVAFCKCDVTKEEEVEHLMKFAVEKFGSLDILVTCAGIWSFAHINDMPEDAFKRVLDVNLNGTFRAAKHASKIMIEQGRGGKMCFVSSNVYTMPAPIFGGYPHYSASKGGIIAMTVEIARELKRYGIIVNTVAPGGMKTPGGITNGIEKALSPEKQAQFAEEMSYMKSDHEELNTDDVAMAVYTMCTDAANGYNGECLICDYGMAHNIVRRQIALDAYPPVKE